MGRLARFAFTAGFALLAGALVYAHVRLIYSGNGNELFWPSPGNIKVVINSDGSDDLPDGEHFTAIRNALDAWNAVSGTRSELVENTKESEQKSRNWESGSRHLVLFDEDNSSGFFPGSSGIVAITPVSFYTTGEIVDADVLFNGKNYGFTTSQQSGDFDVQDVATHELGHLLGLDHSGCAGATMYPYVDASVLLHRSLALDDVRGLRDMYADSDVSKVKGTVLRTADGSVVRGAWVGARDAGGRLVAAALATDKGRFALKDLPSGTYTVYACPLEEPVSKSNLTSGHKVDVDFQSTVLGQATVTGTGTVEMGDLFVDPDTTVSLGRVADDYPIRVVAGESTGVIVRGLGLAAGSTLECSDPSLVLSSITWGNSYVSFDVAVPLLEESGHVDLTVTDPGGDRSILCGGLEITPADPLVASVTPAFGDADGGTSVVVTGTGFRSGLRVVLGDRVYVDGENLQLVDSSTLHLTTAATIPGEHDLVVIDETGVEGRKVGAFEARALPVVDTVFPEAGDQNGGTEVRILGQNFVPGMVVTIDGITQSNVTIESLTSILLETDPGPPGGPYVLTVQSPAGETADAAFVYATKPDPLVSDVSPASGSAGGGETVTITGSNFTPDSQVWFAVGENAGNGGVKAKKVTYVDAGTLRVVTPSCSSKKDTVMVLEGDTGQASLVAGAYAFQGGDSGSSSGGGCASVFPAGPEGWHDGWRDVLSGAGWMLALLGALLLRPRARAAAGA